jgi:hypothetical protein
MAKVPKDALKYQNDMEKRNDPSSHPSPSSSSSHSIQWKPQEDGFRIHAGHSIGPFESLHVPSSPSPSPETIPGCLGFWEAPMAPNDCEACRLKGPCRSLGH